MKCACATPDFHTGSPIPVGSVIVTSHDMVVPQAIGTDINCGMRLHKLGLNYEQFMAQKAKWTALVRGDLLEGTRNIPTSPTAMSALFASGLGDFWAQVQQQDPIGLFAGADFAQLQRELSGLHESSFARAAPTMHRRPCRTFRARSFATRAWVPWAAAITLSRSRWSPNWWIARPASPRACPWGRW
ncbi:hypothetical protein PBOI14_46140 [Pseudomonas sp. Boi14]|nr:hypothetical protein PBOI14_46140 [Pseudomonas sp. Boi14]